MDKNIEHLAKTTGIPPEQFLKQQAINGALLEGKQIISKPAPTAFPHSPRPTLVNRFMGLVEEAEMKSRTTPRTNTPIVQSGAKEAVGKLTKSALTVYDNTLKKNVLRRRKPGEPSILEECKGPIKIFLSQSQSPGDIMMLTAAVRDLHRAYPGQFVTMMRTPCADIWYNNPHQTTIPDDDPDAVWLKCEYSEQIMRSNQTPMHFVEAFHQELGRKLGLNIPVTEAKGSIYLTEDEKIWFSQVREIVGKNIPFWILDAGSKSDFTNKQWEWAKFQELVEALPEITFVQIGSSAKTHRHPEMKGDNVINLVGKTTIRQLVRLMYHAAGVITPVSFPMHLSAAVPVHPRYKRKSRPCVVLSGGREPITWEGYNTHTFLHCLGQLPCCSHGGCWKSRVEPIGDGDNKDIHGLCEMPLVSKSGQVVPYCMDMIRVSDVVRAVEDSLLFYDYSAEDDNKWKKLDYEIPEKCKKDRKAALDKRKKK
jgi:hypothetical protein